MECPFCRLTHRATVPTVHLNGTNGKDLLAGLTAALDALRVAQRAMLLAGPNGRDYYVQGPVAATRAMTEHEQRCLDMNRILTELEEQRDHVYAVVEFEAERRKSR